MRLLPLRMAEAALYQQIKTYKETSIKRQMDTFCLADRRPVPVTVCGAVTCRDLRLSTGANS